MEANSRDFGRMIWPMAMVASFWPTVMSSKANGLMTKLMGLATIITQKEPLTKENGTKTSKKVVDESRGLTVPSLMVTI